MHNRPSCSRSAALSRLVALGLACALVTISACSSKTKSSSSTSTTANRDGVVTTTTPTGPNAIIFNGQGNNLDAYEDIAPFTSQQVITTHDKDPNGLDVNAQICFFPDGSKRFIAGEDTNQTQGNTQGWGIFNLTGDKVGDFQAKETGKLVPTYQSAADNAENYGCGFLSDGRILTTDVGNQATGDGDGQLIVWFPPFDAKQVAYCKVDIGIATAQSIWVDDRDRVYVASARAPTAGVWRYSGPFPTSADTAGGCGQKDPTGAPLADKVDRQIFIAAGEHDLTTPTGIAASPDGILYVSSVINGVINQYDPSGRFVRTVLAPPAGETLGTKTFSTGTPLGIGVGPDGTLYYADIGIVNDPTKGPGPGDHTGSVRRIVFDAQGKPGGPETMAQGLDFPDGIGILVLTGGGGAASKL